MWQILALAFVVISELIWKSIGLWAAAKKNDKVWFIIMFLINTAGILPIIYLKFNTNFFGAKRTTYSNFFAATISVTFWSPAFGPSGSISFIKYNGEISCPASQGI